MSKDLLRKSPLFTDLAEDDLERLYQVTETLDIASGATVFEEGAPGDAMYVVLTGEFEVTKHSTKEEVLLARLGPGDIFGEMALLEQVPRNASVKAKRPSSVIKVSQTAFQTVVCSNTSTLLGILHTVTSRLRNSEGMLRQTEKMAELGKMAAGLAHELNNPAAAVRRSSSLAKETLSAWLASAATLDTLHPTDEQLHVRSALRNEMGKRASTATNLDPITRGDNESDMQTWLEETGVDEPWEVAPILVAATWTAPDLRAQTAMFDPEQLPVLLEWMSHGYSVYSLLSEVGMGAERISEIVKAVKEYSYLDRAPIQQVNVVEGLENTLLILKHKLKQGITVMRDYAPDLPRIEAYASELNQVWTNILDNAADAMEGKGEIRLHTYAEEGYVVVEICDNGPGIPPEVLPRIFENFFTTKPIGLGTGLGLHIARNIIMDKHHGEIKVESKPGRTCFQVKLPLHIERE